MTQRTGQLRSVASGNASWDVRFPPAQLSISFAGAGTLRAYGQFGGRAIVSFAEFEVTSAAAANTLFGTFNGAGNLSVYARQNNQAAARLPGLGNLQVLLSQGNTAAATFSGSGALQVHAT